MPDPLLTSAAPPRLCRRWAAGVLLAALLAGQPGCVERRLTVRSNPPGAQLYVDDYEIGTTPVSVNYTYYARARKIRLVKDGYETAVVNQPMPAPWYQYFPFDFVTENLVPGQIRDERVVTYQMLPAMQVPNDQLVARADALRQNGRAGAAANPQLRIAPSPGVPVQPGPAVAPGILPAPSETLPAPSGSAVPPRQLGPPGPYPPPGGYTPAPTYTPGPNPLPAQPNR